MNTAIVNLRHFSNRELKKSMSTWSLLCTRFIFIINSVTNCKCKYIFAIYRKCRRALPLCSCSVIKQPTIKGSAMWDRTIPLKIKHCSSKLNPSRCHVLFNPVSTWSNKASQSLEALKVHASTVMGVARPELVGVFGFRNIKGFESIFVFNVSCRRGFQWVVCPSFKEALIYTAVEQIEKPGGDRGFLLYSPTNLLPISYMEKDEGFLKFAGSQTALDASSRMPVATMDLDNSGEQDLSELAIGGRYPMTSRSFLEQTEYSDIKPMEGTFQIS